MKLPLNKARMGALKRFSEIVTHEGFVADLELGVIEYKAL